MIRRRVAVTGAVQGVSFRATCGQQAEPRGVTGWVSNRSDGAVEAVFEGDDEAVEAMIDWARHGPDQATVENVEVAIEEPQGESGFEVR